MGLPTAQLSGIFQKVRKTLLQMLLLLMGLPTELDR